MSMNAVMDWDRAARTGLAEAVYAEGKPLSCLADLLEKAAEEKRRLLVTRLSADAFASLPARLTGILDYDALSKTAILGEIPHLPKARVAVVSAGMADASVAQEVCRTLTFAGVGARQIADVGVAGLWRLMARLEDIRAYPVVVVVAGMEGGLFSVLAGLVSAPIIAVPTSTGYGVSSAGQLALHSALGSCAPGVVAVNIDNGFGAAQAALRIVTSLQQAEAAPYRLSSAATQPDAGPRTPEISCASS